MKKILSSVFVLFMVSMMMLLTACQKEQSTTTAESNAVTSENVVSGVVANGSFEGSIAPSYAAALAYNYNKKYDDDDDNITQYVAFDANALKAFITNLQTKYKSKIVYVNFGVYGKGAPAPKGKDNGRLTVFFTGDKIASPVSGGRRNGIADATDEFLNHGNVLP